MIARIACLLLLGCVALGLFLSGPAPAQAPIVLSYAETPIFLGPHQHNVTALFFSPDGRTLASGCDDGLLRLWDAASGRLQSIHGTDSTRGIRGVTYSPAGDLIAVVGGMFGKEADLREAATGRMVREIDLQPAADGAAMPFLYRGEPVDFKLHTAAAFSPDGRLLVTAPDRVIVRDVATNTVLDTPRLKAKGVVALAFTPDGRTLVTADGDRRVRLWSVPAGEPLRTLTGASTPLAALAISPDGARIAAVTRGLTRPGLRDPLAGGQLIVWDTSTGEGRSIALGKRAGAGVAFRNPTSLVVAASRDVLSFDLQADDPAATQKVVGSHPDEIMALALSPDGRLVASGGRDRTVNVIDVDSGQLVHRLPGLCDVVAAVACSPDGSQFASASGDMRFSGRMTPSDKTFAQLDREIFAPASHDARWQPSQVRLWSTGDGRQKSMLPLPTCQVTSIAFIPSSELLAVAGWTPQQGGMLTLWNATSGEPARELIAAGNEVSAIAVTPDGHALASGDADGRVVLWDLATGARRLELPHDVRIEALAFSIDGKQLACGGERKAFVYDATSGQRLQSLNCPWRFRRLAFSPDGRTLAAGTRTPGLVLWDLKSSDERTLKPVGDEEDVDETRAGGVAFSPDGRFVVCAGYGKAIAVFDVAQGTQFCELQGHSHPAMACAFLPDGRLVSGGEERTVRLWDPTAGELLATWVAMPADAAQGWTDQWVASTPQGEYIGSENLDRLAGWLIGGDLIPGPEGGPRRRVEKLLTGQAAPPNTQP